MLDETHVKVFGLIARKANLSKDRFHDHWRHPHATLTLKVPVMTAYFQSHQVDTNLLSDDQRRFEGIAEFWLPDEDSVINWRSNPAVERYLAPDEPNFLDFDRSGYLATRATEIEVPTGPLNEADKAWIKRPVNVSIKLMCLVATGADSAALTRLAGWCGQMGALRQARYQAIDTLQPAEAEFCAVHEAWWPTLEAFRKGVSKSMAVWQELITLSAWHFVLARSEKIL